MADLMALLMGKAKKGSDEAPASEGGPEREYVSEAFSAIKDDDEAGFIDAFLGAVRACSKKAKSSGYDETEGDADELTEE